ncbi:unnamed protein product [Musa textilis]
MAASPAAQCSASPRISRRTTAAPGCSWSAPSTPPSPSAGRWRRTSTTSSDRPCSATAPPPSSSELTPTPPRASPLPARLGQPDPPPPDSDGAIEGHLKEVGLTFHLLKDVPRIIAKNIEQNLKEAFEPLGISDWNSIFWIVHPGGPAILDAMEAKLGLERAKLQATRQVMTEYGNMSSACVLFILDEMRKRSAEDGKATTGEGLEWGVLYGFGPGLTVETVVLHSVAISSR